VAQWTVGNVLEWAEKIHLSAEAVDVLVNKQMAGKDLGEGLAHNCSEPIADLIKMQQACTEQLSTHFTNTAATTTAASTYHTTTNTTNHHHHHHHHHRHHHR
jgi:hypothetical protein